MINCIANNVTHLYLSVIDRVRRYLLLLFHLIVVAVVGPVVVLNIFVVVVVRQAKLAAYHTGSRGTRCMDAIQRDGVCRFCSRRRERGLVRGNAGQKETTIISRDGAREGCEECCQGETRGGEASWRQQVRHCVGDNRAAVDDGRRQGEGPVAEETTKGCAEEFFTAGVGALAE